MAWHKKLIILRHNPLCLKNKLKKWIEQHTFPACKRPTPHLPHPCSSMWALLLKFDLRPSTGTFSGYLIPSGRGHQCIFRDGRLRRPTLSPRPVQQFDFGQALADHGGEEQGKENAADQHVVVVILEHVKLLWGVDPRLVNVQTVSHNL